MTLTLVFHKCGTSQLRSLISALVEDGGALGEPTVTEHLHETRVTARFGPMAGMREVSPVADAEPPKGRALLLVRIIIWPIQEAGNKPKPVQTFWESWSESSLTPTASHAWPSAPLRFRLVKDFIL